MRNRLLAILTFLSFTIIGQNSRFEKLTGYPGEGPWEPYLNLTSASMGPNALPIPPLRWGQFRLQNEAEITLNGYFENRDQTFNPGLRFQYTPLGGRVAFEGRWVPIEVFNYSDKIRDDRTTWSESTSGSAMGDLSLFSMIQILTETTKRPGILLTFGLKTPFGNRLEYSRFTQKLMYSGDLSIGKDLKLSNGIFRVSAMVGWMGYDTYSDPFLNQGPSFGLGTRYIRDSHSLEIGWRGYSGNTGLGDSPQILEIKYEWSFKDITMLLGMGKGIVDYPFTYARMGWRYSFL